MLYLLLHFLCCFLIFAVLQKGAFIAVNRHTSPGGMSARDVADIYRVGYVTDMIAAAYLTALPALVLWVHWQFPMVNVRDVLVAVDVLVALLIVLSSLSDLMLYPHWLSKLDASVLPYLRSLKGAFASVSTPVLVGALVVLAFLWAAVAALLIWLADVTGATVGGEVANTLWGHLAAFGKLVLCLGLLFVVIRGLDHRPHTPSLTFFSKRMFFNHAALNPLYNFIYSLSVSDRPSDVFAFMDKSECDAKVNEMFKAEGEPVVKLLNTDRPNILFIMWESLCSRFVEPLGGEPGVTPNLNKACSEGVLFTNLDCGSFRTDRGLVCLLSGFLAQPTMSIIRNARKLPGLPAVPRRLKENGYSTSVVHGGDLTIMHKIDYYMASGHDEILGIEAFDPSAPQCRWGIHDNFMFDRVADMVLAKGDTPGHPWYMTFQTLSSHTPYKVPYARLDDKVHNAYNFVDDAFGRFVDRLKQSPVWDNLLIVVTGDHGLNDPALVPLPRIDYVKVPLLMFGGAVKAPMRVDTLMSQTDFAATLLGQLGMDHSDFCFSRDIFAPGYTRPFTYHAYNNGFMIHDPEGYTDYDNAMKKAVDNPDAARELQGRMILQTLYDRITAL